MSTCELIFVENDRMIKITPKGEQVIDHVTGVCGQAVKLQQPCFFQNLAKEVQYNSLVDLYSIAPVYMFPIVGEGRTHAVIQLTLTSRQVNKHRFKDPIVSLQQQSNTAK